MMSKTWNRQFFRMLSYISPKWNTKLWYFKKFGRRLDLNRPATLNEKILKIKLEQYGTDPLVRCCADKFAVREYIKDKGLSEILNELYGVYNSPEKIDWEKLPKRFVLKWNFGCKFNLFCEDKSKFDKKEAQKTLKRWGREDFWAYYSELQYKDVPKRIIAERYLDAGGKTLPEDYKFYCFLGHANCVMVCVGRESGWPKFYFFDRNWVLLRINRDSKEAPESFSLPKPAGMDGAFAYADSLSAPFSFVRVDLYLIQGKTIFGELTFTPSAGLDNRRLPQTDLVFGSMMNV